MPEMRPVPDVTDKLPLRAAIYISEDTKAFLLSTENSMIIMEFPVGEHLEQIAYNSFSYAFEEVFVVTSLDDTSRFDVVVKPTFIKDRTTATLKGSAFSGTATVKVAMLFNVSDGGGEPLLGFEKEGEQTLGTMDFVSAGRSVSTLVEKGVHRIWLALGTPETVAMLKDRRKTSASAKASPPREVQVALSDVDRDIPETSRPNPDAVAVVIGNRDYQKAKPVDFALNDSRSIKSYLIKVFGLKEGNIFYVENATQGDFSLYFGTRENFRGKLFNAVRPGRSDVYIYYSGHGAPGLKDRKGYFVPVEADPQYVELGGYPVEVFYENLSLLPARSITVVLDTCFSGANVFENISPMVLEIENPVVNLNKGMVLASSRGKQLSSWYNEKGHGMFTYFFLKAIQDRTSDLNGDNALTFDEIYKYVSDNSNGVPYYARRIHGVEQNPTIEGKFKDKRLVQYK
jgi:hypothetical protein